MAKPSFEVVGGGEEPAGTPRVETAPKKDWAEATKILLLMLKTLSERTIVALADLRTLLSAGAAFYLWVDLPAEPTTGRLIALAMFATFILAINWIWRR